MSVSYCIYKLSKPTKEEVENIEEFLPYITFQTPDEEGYIELFEKDSNPHKNLEKSEFAYFLTLPYQVLNRKKAFAHLGFSEQSVERDEVYMTYSNGQRCIYSDGVKEVWANPREVWREFGEWATAECFAIKFKNLWDSSDGYYSLDHEKIAKYIDFHTFLYAPVTNSQLAKAEIPFLIFEKNKGQTFITKW